MVFSDNSFLYQLENFEANERCEYIHIQFRLTCQNIFVYVYFFAHT